MWNDVVPLLTRWIHNPLNTMKSDSTTSNQKSQKCLKKLVTNEENSNHSYVWLDSREKISQKVFGKMQWSVTIKKKAQGRRQTTKTWYQIAYSYTWPRPRRAKVALLTYIFTFCNFLREPNNMAKFSHNWTDPRNLQHKIQASNFCTVTMCKVRA